MIEFDPKVLLAVDAGVVILCTILLFRYGRLSHSHPAVTYVFFHLYCFTSRLITWNIGVEGLFTSLGPRYEPVHAFELSRAAILADVALIVMTIAWVRVSITDFKKHGRLPQSKDVSPNLSLQHVWRVLVFTFPIGIFGLFSYAYVPIVGNSDYINASTTWLTNTQTWLGIGLVALIYCYGFKFSLTSLMCVYLLVMALQGHHRFRVIITVIILIFIYLDRKDKRWPSAKICIMLLALALLFYPLKFVGRTIKSGGSIGDAATISREIIADALVGQSFDQQFMDQFAAGMTLVDNNGRHYFGKTYLALLTLPIPRIWWPQKPGLADYIHEISRPWRPLGEFGMIVTYLGESYANFGYIGIILIPYLLAYWLARAYFFAYRNHFYSTARLAYLVLASGLIQVFRDGLTSLVLFTLVNWMPLMIIVILHYVFPRKEWRSRVAPLPFPAKSSV
jgi:oligosaccharide repeat unit polymerase